MIYHNLWEVFWWNVLKRNIVDFVSKFPNHQQVKLEYHKLGGMTQKVDIPIWKWEVNNMDFIIGLPRNR